MGPPKSLPRGRAGVPNLVKLLNYRMIDSCGVTSPTTTTISNHTPHPKVIFGIFIGTPPRVSSNLATTAWRTHANPNDIARFASKEQRGSARCQGKSAHVTRMRHNGEEEKEERTTKQSCQSAPTKCPVCGTFIGRVAAPSSTRRVTVNFWPPPCSVCVSVYIYTHQLNCIGLIFGRFHDLSARLSAMTTAGTVVSVSFGSESGREATNERESARKTDLNWTRVRLSSCVSLALPKGAPGERARRLE